MYYLSMDGGGTKLVGLLFDEQYRLVSWARAEGTHRAIYPLAQVRSHIASCYADLFAGLPRPLHIETLYTICGSNDLYTQMLPQGITVGNVRFLNEAVSGLYAGICCHTGFVALSGTGSDVFCVREDKMVDMIGGWGAILGDEGSGVWMAQQAMQAAIHAHHGWGAPTCFESMVMERFGFRHLRGYVDYLYDTPAPFRRLGELLPMVAEAANAGDEVMLDVFRRGGKIMAEQMCTVLRRQPDMAPVITACGGAWKAHPAMAQAFRDAIAGEFPHIQFSLPLFEHILAGPVCYAMEQGLEADTIIPLLKQNFPCFLWNSKL